MESEICVTGTILYSSTVLVQLLSLQKRNTEASNKPPLFKGEASCYDQRHQQGPFLCEPAQEKCIINVINA